MLKMMKFDGKYARCNGIVVVWSTQQQKKKRYNGRLYMVLFSGLYSILLLPQNMCESMNLYIVLIYSVGRIGFYVDRGEVVSARYKE